MHKPFRFQFAERADDGQARGVEAGGELGVGGQTLAGRKAACVDIPTDGVADGAVAELARAGISRSGRFLPHGMILQVFKKNR